MSDPGDSPPPYQPRHGPPPPPPPPQPPPQPQYGFAHQPVDVDPASAGLVRKERPGWAIGFVVVGAALMVGSLFVDWVRPEFFDFRATSFGTKEPTTVFSAIDDVRDLTAEDPDGPDPGPLARLFFPWLAIVLTLVCVAVALVATVGLRRPARTNLARVVAGLVVVGTVGVSVLALTSLGWQISTGDDDGVATPTTVGPTPDGGGPRPESERFSSNAEPFLGAGLWWLGAAVLVLAVVLGPRIVHLLPAGAGRPTYGGAPAASLPPGPPHGLLRHSTQVAAIVLAALGLVLCFAGYGFLSWATSGDTVTFSDLGEAARDAGFGDKAFAEAYFGWLGWVVLLWTAVVLVLVALGKKPAGVNPKVLRPILTTGSLLCLLAHLAAMVQLDGDWGLAAFAVGLGVAVAALGSMLPLRTTARVVTGS